MSSITEAARFAGVIAKERLFAPNPEISMMDLYPELSEITKWPKVVMITPDGNARWAKKLGKTPSYGHAFAIRNIATPMIRRAADLEEVEAFVGFVASYENMYGRKDDGEIDALMDMTDWMIVNLGEELVEKNRRFLHIGNRGAVKEVNPLLLAHMDDLMDATKNNTGQLLVLPVAFSGLDQDIRVLQRAHERGLTPPITEQTLWELRDGGGVLKSVDAMIRTAGDFRLSDVGWLNGANTQPIYRKENFPEFREKHLVDSLVQFSKIERRMGGRPTVEPQEFSLL